MLKTVTRTQTSFSDLKILMNNFVLRVLGNYLARGEFMKSILFVIILLGLSLNVNAQVAGLAIIKTVAKTAKPIRSAVVAAVNDGLVLKTLQNNSVVMSAERVSELSIKSLSFRVAD